jgi:hypothetical protein
MDNLWLETSTFETQPVILQTPEEIAETELNATFLDSQEELA